MLSLIIGDIWKEQNNAIKSEMISVLRNILLKIMLKDFQKLKIQILKI